MKEVSGESAIQATDYRDTAPTLTKAPAESIAKFEAALSQSQAAQDKAEPSKQESHSGNFDRGTHQDQGSSPEQRTDLPKVFIPTSQSLQDQSEPAHSTGVQSASHPNAGPKAGELNLQAHRVELGPDQSETAGLDKPKSTERFVPPLPANVQDAINAFEGQAEPSEGAMVDIELRQPGPKVEEHDSRQGAERPLDNQRIDKAADQSIAEDVIRGTSSNPQKAEPVHAPQSTVSVAATTTESIQLLVSAVQKEIGIRDLSEIKQGGEFRFSLDPSIYPDSSVSVELGADGLELTIETSDVELADLIENASSELSEMIGENGKVKVSRREEDAQQEGRRDQSLEEEDEDNEF